MTVGRTAGERPAAYPAFAEAVGEQVDRLRADSNRS